MRAFLPFPGIIELPAFCCQIGAHVVVLSKTKAGFAPVNSFDVQVKASNTLPPIGVVGLALHAAKAPSQTLSADANKLAGQIVKKLNEETSSKR